MKNRQTKNQTKPKVSVIMPVYNTEETYLTKSIDSVLNQTYKSFELIIVDDGSCNYIANVCEKFAVKDSRILVLHKDNEGVSSARNYALKLIKGEYFTFLDSDDIWGKNFLEDMLFAITNNNLDMVMCSYSIISESDNLLKEKDITDQLDIMSTSEAINKFLYMKYPSDASAVFATIYKTSELGCVQFDTDVSFAEDVLYKFRCMKKCMYIAYLHKPLMAYRIRMTGIMKSRFKAKHLRTLIKLEELAMDEKEYKEALIWRLVRICFVLLRMKGITEENAIQINSIIKKYRWYVLGSTKFDLKMYGAIILNFLKIL